MKYIIKLFLPVVAIFFVSEISFSQCNQEQTISICDMENIDFDNDTNPDGFINLYTRTGTTPADGVWSTAVNYAIALDSSTGELSTWELRNSTFTDTDDYEFVLSNNTCGSIPFMTLDLILGPYSGVALPPDDDDINYYICSEEEVNLNTVLISNNVTPVAHINGSWSLSGANPAGGNLLGSVFSGDVEYQPGLPRVDQDVYELVYTVPGITPCANQSQTFVKVAIVRQVDAGTPSVTEICENDILAGNWDMDISVRDDEYLIGEDIEGFWDDDLNGTADGDLIINIRDIYNELIDNGNNPRFGCNSNGFTYTVEKRSVVCSDESSSVLFIIQEQLRPFQQAVFPEICPVEAGDPSGVINLLDLIEFEDGFVYDGEETTHWEFVSGPSNLGLVSKRGEGITDVTSLRCISDPARNNDNLEPPYYSPDGTINIGGAQAGEYRFRFFVCASAIGCSSGCPDIEREVVIQILPFDYAGENTADLIFCQEDGSVDLQSLLNTNGVDMIVDTGVWTDGSNAVVDNTFVFPTIVDPQVFTFTYTATSNNGCEDSAILSFTVYKEANAGNGTAITLCSDDLTVTLFDLLEGDPDITGIWTGPFGYTSPDHFGVFDASDDMLPIIGPGEYTYTVSGNMGCVEAASTSVNIAFVDPIEIGTDRSDTFCILDGRVSLYSILDQDTSRTGFFEDIENTGALTAEGVVEFDQLPNPGNLVNPIYNFRYVVSNQAPCDESSLNVEIQIIDLPEPNVLDQQFCILDAKRLDDIEVDVLNYNWYTTLESDTSITDNPLLFDNQLYYIANVDAENCESERVAVAIEILNMGERSSDGELCTLDFQDGVSPDGNNQNDVFELVNEDIDEFFNIPEAYPDFELKIFNRYGTLVYKGTIDTEKFRGESNVSIRLGDDLPSGTYFYIFTPNFEDNLPIQGSFYLSR